MDILEFWCGMLGWGEIGVATTSFLAPDTQSCIHLAWGISSGSSCIIALWTMGTRGAIALVHMRSGEHEGRAESGKSGKSFGGKIGRHGLQSYTPGMWR